MNGGFMKENDFLFDNLTQDIVKSILETIPGELTIINKDDEVIGWNKHSTRIFRRPVVAMGANFRDCHPEESLSRVEKIVNDMKNGKMNRARFWIDMRINEKGERHKILIEFYALRDINGNYLGCMEYDMDIEDIIKITGEKRLMGE
jgi:DUF438 domain-containing protein